jgi:hypothetical protein
MTEVNIVKPFTFTHDDGSQEAFIPGRYDLPDELAEHFYVKAHSDEPEPVALRPGMPQHASQLQRYASDQLTLQQQEDMHVLAAAEAARKEFREANAKRRVRLPNSRPQTGGPEGSEGEEELPRPGEYQTEAEGRLAAGPDDLRAQERAKKDAGSARAKLKPGAVKEEPGAEGEGLVTEGEPQQTAQQIPRGPRVDQPQT